MRARRLDIDTHDGVREAFDPRRRQGKGEGRPPARDEEEGDDKEEQCPDGKPDALGIAQGEAQSCRRDDDSEDTPATGREPSTHPTGTPATTCSMA